jgi:hypothetical protein
MTQRDPITRPYIDFLDDTDWSDCSRFLDECVSALIEEVGGALADPRDAPSIVAGMLEAAAADLKPKRGRPRGSRNRKLTTTGSASTVARRKREERQRADEERWEAAQHEEWMRVIEDEMARNK